MSPLTAYASPLQPFKTIDSHLPLLRLPAPNVLISPSYLCLLETSLTLALTSSPALSETPLIPRLFPHKMLSKSNCPLAATSLDKCLPAKYPIQNIPLCLPKTFQVLLWSI